MDTNETVARVYFTDCHCDKCGLPVTFDNNAVLVDMEVRGAGIEHLLAHGRHMLPVYQDGRKVCEGSPSRGQYIEGQPRDTRSSYPYRLEDEKGWREAHARVLLKYGEQAGTA